MQTEELRPLRISSEAKAIADRWREERLKVDRQHTQEQQQRQDRGPGTHRTTPAAPQPSSLAAYLILQR